MAGDLPTVDTPVTSATPPEPPPPDEPGGRPFAHKRPGGSVPTEVGPWKIVRLLGEGGFGVVYQAERKNPAQSAAIKLVKPGMDSQGVLARFDAERQALALLTHPNIARLYQAGLHDDGSGGRPYFAMEYVAGLPITEYCRQRELSVADRLRLFQQVCRAVQHAHLKAIIHRDISARNVLVTEVDGEPTAKVIDFGIAKAVGEALTDQTINTGAGNIIGNYAYMSPEQASGDPDIDARTDIYSLGVLLY
jgi:eukaryotic-like serine/threonine-protein kinase